VCERQIEAKLWLLKKADTAVLTAKNIQRNVLTKKQEDYPGVNQLGKKYLIGLTTDTQIMSRKASPQMRWGLHKLQNLEAIENISVMQIYVNYQNLVDDKSSDKLEKIVSKKIFKKTCVLIWVNLTSSICSSWFSRSSQKSWSKDSLFPACCIRMKKKTISNTKENYLSCGSDNSTCAFERRLFEYFCPNKRNNAKASVWCFTQSWINFSTFMISLNEKV